MNFRQIYPWRIENRNQTNICEFITSLSKYVLYDWVQRTREIEYKNLAILYGHLDGWLFCTVKNQFNQSAARTTLLYLLCFSRLERNELKDLDNK